MAENSERAAGTVRRSMPPDRVKLLRVALNQPHRYRRVRMATMAVTLLILFGVPLAGIARIDLAGDAHMALMRPVPLRTGLIAVAAAIVGFYAVTFFINIVAGRMFCGFGCPVGQLSRFSDQVDAFLPDLRRRRRAWAELIGFALLLSLAGALWFVSPAVFSRPTAGALCAGLAIAAVAAYAVFHARHFRWGFCQKLCPIGLYYSMVQTPALVRVAFDPRGACTDCEACAGICPVHLDPRHLDALTPSPGGLGFMDLPGNARCLECGACIEICEHMTRKQVAAAAMGFRRRSQRVAPR